MTSTSVRPVSWRKSAIALAAACVALLFLLVPRGARAAEQVYWNNYSGDPDSIGYAAIDGSGGGALNLGATALNGPEGMAYDSVSNRILVASSGDDRIVAVNLDGSGATDFTAPGATIKDPDGLVVDPETRTVYWINTELDTISWARLDGSIGGTVGTNEFKVDAYRLSLDPVAKRLYWYDGTAHTIASVSTAGGAVSELNIAGATAANDSNGVAVEPGLGKVFWLNGSVDAVSWAYLSGAGGGDIAAAEKTYFGPYGLVVDAALGRVYWPNYGEGENRSLALGFLSLAGSGGGVIPVATAPVDGPQDPLVLKSPVGTGAPALTRGSGSARAQLSCTTGTWGADVAGAFLYEAPRSFAYQWAKNGTPIGGATAATYSAQAAGSYACTVTAANQVGSTAQASAAAKVKAAKLKLSGKTKAEARAGKLATFSLKAANQGDVRSAKAKLCVKLSGAAKQALKAPKCKQLGKLASTKKKAAKLKVKVKPSAEPGAYKLTFQVKGASGKSLAAKVVVSG